MNQVVERKRQGFLEKTASRLLPLFEMDLPLPIKAKGIQILAKTRTPAARQAVIKFFQTFPELEEAIRALAILGGDEVQDIMIRRAQDTRAFNRDIIAEQLTSFKNPTSFNCLRELLGDQDRLVRFQAANTLFNHGGRDCALALCKYISDADEWISMTILKLLCKMKEHESIPFLAEQFARDSDLRRKALMISFLAMFRSVTLVNIFDEGIHGKDARLKANSIEAIGDLELPEREISARISPFLKDPNNRIRANSILALAKKDPERIRPEIVLMVESNDIQLRRSAAYILGQISPHGNEELARKLVVDSSDDVRRRMVLSLKNFPVEFTQNQLMQAIHDPNKWIRKHSIDMAANIRSFPKEGILKQLRAETCYPNLVAAMEFFSKHPDEEAGRLIRQRIKDKREPVVSGVIRAIGAMFGIKGLQAIAQQINYRDPKVLKSFVSVHFSLGGLEIFDSILEKSVQIKKPPVNDMFFPALESCIDMLNAGEKMPPGLQTELARASESIPIPEVSAPPPPAPQPAPMPVPPRPIPQMQPVPQAGGFQAPPPMPSAPPQPPDLTEPEFPEPPQGIPTEHAAPHAPPDFMEPPPIPDLLEPAVPSAAPEPPKKAKPKLHPVFTSGVKLFNLGKYKKARQAFQQVLTEDPALTKAHFFLGMIAFEQKELEPARESLSLFLESEPDNLKAQTTLGKIYKATRDWPNAVRMFERILATPEALSDKARAKVSRELGTALIFTKDYEKARNILEKLFKSDPTDIETNFHLAMSHFHLQNYMRAETLLSDVVKQSPKGERLRTMADSLLEKIRQSLIQAPPQVQPRNGPEETDEGGPGLELPVMSPPPPPETPFPAISITSREPAVAPRSPVKAPVPVATESTPPAPQTPDLGALSSPPPKAPLYLDLSDLKLDPLSPDSEPEKGPGEMDTDAFFNQPAPPPAKEPPPEPPPAPPTPAAPPAASSPGATPAEKPKDDEPIFDLGDLGGGDGKDLADDFFKSLESTLPQRKPKKDDETPPDSSDDPGGFNLPSI